MSIFSPIKALSAVTLGALLFLPTFANADGVGWMIGGGGYYSQLDDGVEIDWDDLDSINFDSSSGAVNVTGGYRFNKWLSLDGGYWDLGDFKSERDGNGQRTEFDATSFTLGGMVSVPLWVLDLYAKGGAAFWEYDGSFIDEDGTDPYYGVGGAVNIGGSLDLYLEWVRFDLETNIDTVGLGVRWTF